MKDSDSENARRSNSRCYSLNVQMQRGQDCKQEPGAHVVEHAFVYRPLGAGAQMRQKAPAQGVQPSFL